MPARREPSPDVTAELAARWPRLQRRAELLRQLREFFHERGFTEVETPLLEPEVIVEEHLDPLWLTLYRDPARPHQGPQWFLQCSPELGMKRLLAAGAKAIFQITRAFRAGEQGRWHHVEFTMLEWYRCGDTQEEALGRLSDLVQRVLNLPPAKVFSYRELFQQYLNIDPWQATSAELRQGAIDAGLEVPASWDEADRDLWLQWLFAERIEPELGAEGPAIVFGFPPSQAVLARVSGQPPVAERFELFVHGVELANGYHELSDAEELLRRMHQANQRRRRLGKPELPIPHGLIEVHRRGVPDCWGVALGLDRLVALALGAESITEVMAFPEPRA